MTTITLHVGAVGTGKSRNWLNPGITSKLESKESILLVVPSIKLQSELREQYPKAVIINNEADTQSVISQIHKIFKTKGKGKMIIITHAAFQMLEYNISLGKKLVCDVSKEWILAIDESFKITDSIEHKEDKQAKDDETKRTRPKFNDIIIIDDTPSVTKWHKVHVDKKDDSIFSDSKVLRKLSNTNWESVIHAGDLKEWRTGVRKVNFYQLLKTDCLKQWKEVYIAGERLDELEMGHWMKNDPELKLNIEHHFEPRKNIVNVYTTNSSVTKSMFKPDTPEYPNKEFDPEFINGYFREFKPFIAGRKLLALRNNYVYSNTFENETKLDHNMHGLNQYRHTHQVISFESALNASKIEEAFYKEYCNISAVVLFDTRTVSTCHQGIGRTGYRNINNTEVITVGIMCKKTAENLFKKFLNPDLCTLTYMDVTSKKDIEKINKTETPEELKEKMNKVNPKLYYQSGPRKGQPKPPAMTSTERAAKSRANKEMNMILTGVK